MLRDWYYKKTPQVIWCIRRLTGAILDAPPDDELRVAFLLHWVSHYFVDAIWTCHVAQRYMADASPAEKKEFDNGIEREVEEITSGQAFDAPPLDGRGYWTLFWQGRLESDRRSGALIDAWQRGAGCLPIAMESVPHCAASFAAYLVYLDGRREARAWGQAASPMAPQFGASARVIWSGGPAHAANAWAVAMQCALESSRSVEECLIGPGGADAVDGRVPDALAGEGSIAVALPGREAPIQVTAAPGAEVGGGVRTCGSTPPARSLAPARRSWRRGPASGCWRKT